MPMQLPPAVRAAIRRKWAADARRVAEDYLIRARAADDEAAAIEQQVRDAAVARREASADRRQAREHLGQTVREIEERDA